MTASICPNSDTKVQYTEQFSSGLEFLLSQNLNEALELSMTELIVSVSDRETEGQVLQWLRRAGMKSTVCPPWS